MIRPFYDQFDIEDVKLLIQILNSSARKTRPDGYKELVQIIREFSDLRDDKTIAYNLFRDEEEKTSLEQIKGDTAWVVDGERILVSDPKFVRKCAESRLSNRIAKYSFSAAVDFWRDGRPRVQWEGSNTTGSLVYLVVRLAEFDLLRRVRQCEHCTRWFCAGRKAKIFCTRSCSKLHWQSSSTGKEKRRKYMQKYMQKYRKDTF